ncbi:Sugar phosphate exchanger 3 [Tupaia chinensis]|uniref:Sugar phosphate exchanger 3 n=1 Tax=Tupaia chinensis TaxID=246437 RepID=L9L1A7_TUPCH|nr:Sugar phosphate exchanger 3 [Tupaia chinensis]
MPRAGGSRERPETLAAASGVRWRRRRRPAEGIPRSVRSSDWECGDYASFRCAKCGVCGLSPTGAWGLGEDEGQPEGVRAAEEMKVVEDGGYSLLHASRKTFSNVKVSISKQWTPSAFNTSVELPVEIWSSNHLFPNAEEATLFLGTLDTIFLFSYAAVFVFGTLTEWLRFYDKWLYCCLWVVNGLLQSTGWPCVVAVMGNWFGKAGRGVVFGLWSACASVGNILGACLASSVLQYGYEYAFLVTASVQFSGGIVIFFGLLVSPEEIGLPGIETEENSEEDSHRPLISGAENEDEFEPNYSIQEDSALPQVKAISFHQACCLPGVIPGLAHLFREEPKNKYFGFAETAVSAPLSSAQQQMLWTVWDGWYSLAYACLKLVNYSFFFWLPFYLSNNFEWKEADADKLSIWYDVGGIIGGTLQGFVSDILQKRAPVLALSLLLAVGSLVGYSHSPKDKSINALLMTVTGFFIGGPSNMISSAISADLGRQELIRGSSEALATVTGIVDGTGSIGAAVGQTSCTILFISPLIVREVFHLVQRRHTHMLSE